MCLSDSQSKPKKGAQKPQAAVATFQLPKDYTTETLLEGSEGLLKITCRLNGPAAAQSSMRFSLASGASATASPVKSRSYTQFSEEECWCDLALFFDGEKVRDMFVSWC